MSDTKATFDAATEAAKKLPERPDNETMLKLYSYFKQATEGPIGDRPRPGIFDQVGRAKWDSWASLKDLSKEDAKKQYIELVDSL